MADEPIPEELRDFILKYIDSVAHLEALLLLRANPNETWDVANTAKRLYIGDQQTGEVLARLCVDGLVTREGDVYRYAGQPSDLLTMVDRLAEAYSRNLIPITNMIHAKPRRIREFADAFKFRKDR